MKVYGAKVCAGLKSFTGTIPYGQPNGLPDPVLSSVYYDGAEVFYQIADYTGDNATWYPCAAAAQRVYRDLYLIPNGGGLPGYWLFPHGLADSFTRLGDSVSLTAYTQLLAHGSFVQQSVYNDAYEGGTGSWYAMRELAYGLMVQLHSKDFGIAPNAARIIQLKDLLFLSLDQAFGTKSALYRKPFMAALASQALIEYTQYVQNDPGILPRIQMAADYMWSNMWIANPKQYKGTPSFEYTDDPRTAITGSSDVMFENRDKTGKLLSIDFVAGQIGEGEYETPDLNNLIAPVYGWLYAQTGDPKYRTEGDQIFSSGAASLLNLDSGKQFDQGYRWSFNYLGWTGRLGSTAE